MEPNQPTQVIDINAYNSDDYKENSKSNNKSDFNLLSYSDDSFEKCEEYIDQNDMDKELTNLQLNITAAIHFINNLITF